MKNIISTSIAISLISVTSYSMELSCKSKYFINQPAKVILTANSFADDNLMQVSLKIDNEEVRKVRTVKGRDYNGNVYKDMILFNLENTVDSGLYDSTSMSLMLPQGWGEQGKFIGYIIEKASDGGTYNKIFCSTID